jgi:hypothetical protein
VYPWESVSKIQSIKDTRGETTRLKQRLRVCLALVSLHMAATHSDLAYMWPPDYSHAVVTLASSSDPHPLPNTQFGRTLSARPQRKCKDCEISADEGRKALPVHHETT